VRGLLAVALAALLAVPGAAAAHRGHASLSVVEIDAATGAVTITHHAAAHDVEPALAEIAPDAQQSLDDADALKALEAYAGRVFRLWDAEGKPVALVHKRTRLGGDEVEMVYTAKLPSPAAVVSVDSGLFEEAHADQENQVNVRRNKVTKTVVFRLGDGPQRVSFD
jgi:Cu/Ag efflux protein CusF